MKELKIFLSYCRKDAKTADDIYMYFEEKKDIKLYRDIIDIGSWQSIKEYMQSIEDMDYRIKLHRDVLCF